MKHRTAIAISAVVIAAASLTACGGNSDSAPAKSPAPAAPSSAPTPDASKAIKDAEAKSGIPPKPDAATQEKYIAALNAISPDIVSGKEDRAVSRGRDTCGTIHSFPKDHAKQVDLTRQRFSGAHQFTTSQAEQILTAVQSNLCPKN
ncbi:hypothetical protein EYS09_14335 [Streptomyces kasugaensis]|uniref:DUF732 domain-containing protein n=1 Tax=Streptomyces kasugaensis TaxID=1946 RepID=A0A4Q9HV78_STRKA|nr:hypothetical protein [Streptomyces kasugaensis]TBO59017.1 hypothetical protein EYS09_14335 [Streptomyces kasugaensis]